MTVSIMSRVRSWVSLVGTVLRVAPRCAETWGMVVWFAITLARAKMFGATTGELVTWCVVTVAWFAFVAIGIRNYIRFSLIDE